MKVAVFVGPTIPAEQIKELLPDAWILPPAEQGDIDFVRGLGFDVIALIDGVHRQRLPVWHKEILQCLQAGSRIVGSASMGALRAVECQPSGFGRVLVVDFPIEDAPFACVRVLIPKMAGYFYLHGVEYGRLEGRP